MKDDLGENLKKVKNGFKAFVVTTIAGETTFASYRKAMRDHKKNVEDNQPSYVAKFLINENNYDCVNAHAAYRSDELP